MTTGMKQPYETFPSKRHAELKIEDLLRVYGGNRIQWTKVIPTMARDDKNADKEGRVWIIEVNGIPYHSAGVYWWEEEERPRRSVKKRASKARLSR